VLAEPESTSLIARLRSEPRMATSELALAEAPRAIRRIAGDDSAAAGPLLTALGSALRRFALLDVDREILALAGRLEDPVLRALDAIHLATALGLGDRVNVFVSYDRRQIAAARHAGLAVASPGP